MHTTDMPESAGALGAPSATKYKCPKCGQVEMTCQTWESHCGGALTEARRERAEALLELVRGADRAVRQAETAVGAAEWAVRMAADRGAKREVLSV